MSRHGRARRCSSIALRSGAASRRCAERCAGCEGSLSPGAASIRQPSFAPGKPSSRPQRSCFIGSPVVCDSRGALWWPAATSLSTRLWPVRGAAGVLSSGCLPTVLLETDGPYTTTAGTPTEPVAVRSVLQVLSSIWGTSAADTAEWSRRTNVDCLEPRDSEGSRSSTRECVETGGAPPGMCR